MASDAQRCGHRDTFFHYLTGEGGTQYVCGVCHGSPGMVCAYAKELAGVEFRQGELAWASLVVAEPDSDVPRLVFADWLDDQGDDRGELVRVECELRRIEDGHGPPWPDYAVQACRLLERRAALRRQLGYDT